MFSNDAEIAGWVTDKLYVPVVSDILDSLGYRHQVM
ncbi:MAG: RraA family protein, partial [Chloroflexi bacterium]|nr:RraA family protein [Chloroflexota bacterium]